MSLNQIVNRRRLRRRAPLGTVIGLLTASVATGLGVISGLDPYVILFRAGISGMIIGIVVSFGLSMIQLANLEPNRSTTQSRRES